MKFTSKYLISLVVLLFLLPFFILPITYSWGFFGHQKINRMAVFTLPPEMIKFYKKNIEYITRHAVDADKRRYSVEGEGVKHYIDIDHYSNDGEDPFDVMPQKWNEAVEKYTQDTLQAYGIIPWHINVKVKQLTQAFEANDVGEILKVSADLGHYIADAHVPLHTTKNYNGQLTNQKGIHGFWESRLPELKHREYDFMVGRAEYVDNILEDTWKNIEQSFRAKDSVLDFERILSKQFPSDKKYVYENRGNTLIKSYSEEYSTEYHNMLNGMVERRLTQSVIKVGSYWYTAWVNAGQPNLNILLDDLSDKFLKQEEELNEQHQAGKAKGRVHWD